MTTKAEKSCPVCSSVCLPILFERPSRTLGAIHLGGGVYYYASRGKPLVGLRSATQTAQELPAAPDTRKPSAC